MHCPTIALSIEPHLIKDIFNVWFGYVLRPKILSDYALERRPPFLVANPVICINSFWGPPKYV